MSNQILAGAVFQAGQVIAGVDADTILDTFIAPPTGSSTVANKIFMWSSDAASYQSGVGRSDVGGVVMTDGDFSNPTTIQLDSPQMVVGGEGKVVTISYLGEIKVYDESTGQLEQSFTDPYRAASVGLGGDDAVIGAGKIFISSPEQNPKGVGSIAVIDLLDRNVATYLITPTLGDYSRLSSTGWGGIKFIDGRIYGHTSMWSSADRGIWHFAPDGSDEQFIPVPGMGTSSGLAKWGDNFVVGVGDAIQVIDSSGAVLHSKSDPAGETFGFSKDFDVTSTGKLVALRRVDTYNNNFSIYLYDEGFTNEIVINGADQPNGIASYWGYGTTTNSGGFEVFGEYILVSAKEADNNGITNCGAVYRYNDSGVLQDIFYGTVADQKIGTNISVGTATTTTTLPAFIAPSTTSSTVANKILMWYPVSGLLMTDAAFANPLTLSSESPRAVAAGGGKVVSISFFGEINVYDSSTGALETTFTDTLVDHGKTRNSSATAHSCAIGAGKIFINSPEHNSTGVGSIIVVDLLDRNVPSFLITPALGNYSRLGHQSFGRIQFIDGKIHAGTSPFSAADMGIHSFDPDGSNHTFIPTTFAPLCIVKFGDNYAVANEDHGVEIISPTGQVLNSKQIGSYGFGSDIDVTSTNKLVVRRQISQYDQAVYIYDEGFTNEIIISQGDQPNTSGGTTPADALWLSEARENSGGLQTINGDILVTATKASSDTVNESGAIYRYNDSGVLQEIFYGTVAGQRLGTYITVGTETSTTALPAFIAPPVNNPPVISGIDASYTLTTGSDTVITGTATDPEGDAVTWTYVVSSGSLNDTTVSQTDNVFTIIPGPIDATFQLSFTATDDKGKVSTHVSDFTYYYVEPASLHQLWRLYVNDVPSLVWGDGHLWDINDAGGITLGDGRQLSTSGTSGTAMSATYGQIPVAGKYGIYTSNDSNPFTQITANAATFGSGQFQGNNMFNGERTYWASSVGHSILWYLHDPIEYTAMEGGSVNLRTHSGSRPNRCPQEILLQYYTGDLNSAYNSTNWTTFATLRSNQTEGSPTWTNITEGSTKTV